MKSKERVLMTIVFVILGLISLAFSLVLSLRNVNVRRRWHTTQDRAMNTGRYVARWWALRATVAKEMDALEARFNDYFRELMVQLLPHERDKVERYFLETEVLIRRARIQRRMGRFATARTLVNSAEYAINRACGQLPADRQVIWSEVCHYQ